MAAPKAGGFKLSLSSAKNKPGLKPGLKAPTQNLAKRPRLAFDDDEPEDDNKKQEIVGWDAAEGGAVDINGKKEAKALPVIPLVPDRDWRAVARRRQAQRDGVLPPQNGQNGENSKQLEVVTWGLTVPEKRAEAESSSSDTMDASGDGKPDDGLTADQRLEKNALDALLHGKPATDDTVIPIQTEEEAFQTDIQAAPEAPTLAAYEATPIEGFGAALLRGMGWKDGEQLGRAKNGSAPQSKEIKRRPALLGIGAKDEAAAGIELGEWGKGQKKVRQSYNPVTLRNKVTGEMVTEEELKKRLEAQKLVPEKAEKSSSKYDDDHERRRDRRTEKRRDDDYDSERRRERRKEKRRDDDYESERPRDKKKYKDDSHHDSERRREKRRDQGDDYDDRERKREKRRGKDDDYYDSDRRREKKKYRADDSDDGYEIPNDQVPEQFRAHILFFRGLKSPTDERLDELERQDRERDRERRHRHRSRSRDSEDRRKRRRREYDYEDERAERKRRHKEKY